MDNCIWLTTGLLLAGGLSAQDERKAAEQSPPVRPYALMVGDAAPRLSIETWVKGDPVEAFEKDHVYVVEFWATWCGPCIRGMPHLSELQEQYSGKVTIIGVNIWDEPENVAPFMKEDVPIHDKPGDEVMRYTVAIEEKHDPDDVRHGRMAKEWMAAAGRGGIPSAFIVDRKGRIAWIGHPVMMDGALAGVVAGEWDLEAEKRDYAVRAAGKAKVAEYNRLFAGGEYQRAYALGRELLAGPLAKDSMGLNLLAWRIVDPAKPPKVTDLDLALDAAVRANELGEGKNPYILDTLAMVHHARGDLKKAVEWQRLAVEHAGDEPIAAELRERLEQFEKEAAAAEASGGKKKGGEAKRRVRDR